MLCQGKQGGNNYIYSYNNYNFDFSPTTSGGSCKK